jgi:hypothetical protein
MRQDEGCLHSVVRPRIGPKHRLGTPRSQLGVEYLILPNVVDQLYVAAFVLLCST